MNSKESIQKIKDFKVVFSEGVIYPFEDYYKEEIATNEKDLDILELLHNKQVLLEIVRVCENYKDYVLLVCRVYGNMVYRVYGNIDIDINEQEFDLLKEWLKNE